MLFGTEGLGNAEDVDVALRGQARRSAREKEASAERACLQVRPLCQVSPTDTIRKPEVVADQRARTRLTADNLCLNDYHLEAFGRRVYGCGEPCWPRADDGYVERLVRVVVHVHPQRVYYLD